MMLNGGGKNGELVYRISAGRVNKFWRWMVAMVAHNMMCLMETEKW